jgi:LPXTG-site transpeptidase (sortase) family protein
MPKPELADNSDSPAVPDEQTPMQRAALEAAHSEASWNEYYNSLSDEGKRQLWFDYYARIHTTETDEKPGHTASTTVVSQVSKTGGNFFSLKNQLRSMAFGVACGVVVVLAFSFTLFNEVIIAPFIRPGQHIAEAQVVDPSGEIVDTSPKVVIPKINVDIPVVYGASADEKEFELALDNGVVHYPTTALPGQPGNAAFFGHSSNNIFNPGKYKFAFVLLHEIVTGDQFSLTYNGTQYTYEVISKQVVKPTDVGVLGPVDGQQATATLITCDPPGTSTNRLVVVGRQISPSLAGATTPAIQPTNPPTTEALSSDLPGNGPGLLTRMWRSVFGGESN